MEPESSLPFSKEFANSLYSEPEESSPCLPFYFPAIHFNIVLLPAGLPTRTFYTFLSLPCVLHALSILAALA
jgi:hypothetical protein